MKICVDENIPLLSVGALRSAGHDVADIRSTAEQGITDDVLWAKAQREERLLITTDKGFAVYKSKPHYGIIVIRLRQPNEQKIHQRIMDGIIQLPEDNWQGVIIVLHDTVQNIWRNAL
jgi:predicted nuclease of predicted toxin-antitoxin system